MLAYFKSASAALIFFTSSSLINALLAASSSVTVLSNSAYLDLMLVVSASSAFRLSMVANLISASSVLIQFDSICPTASFSSDKLPSRVLYNPCRFPTALLPYTPSSKCKISDTLIVPVYRPSSLITVLIISWAAWSFSLASSNEGSLLASSHSSLVWSCGYCVSLMIRCFSRIPVAASIRVIVSPREKEKSSYPALCLARSIISALYDTSGFDRSFSLASASSFMAAASV